jgi:glutamine synthetase
MVLKYDDVMKALDNYILARLTISHHFRQKGLVVSFLPKLSDDQGTGCHCHISIWKGKTNVLGSATGKYKLSKDGEAFLAGIVRHFNALVHFLAPSPNSIRRIKPECWVGNYKFWSIENKEAPIRLLPSKSND